MTIETFTPTKSDRKAKTTYKIAGVLYREIYTSCGKETCQKCKAGPSHLQTHQYMGNGKWAYMSVPPTGERESQQGKCKRQGCDGITQRYNQAYCSDACKQMAYRERKAKA
jgi:hypothetical protein